MIKKTVTAKKLAANRNNSLNSTGPKSERGKAQSRRNALKHGILATTLLVIANGGEDGTEFQDLLGLLTRDLAPKGGVEELWVAKIALCWWRQKLALTCELKLAPKTFQDSMYWSSYDLDKAENQERHDFVLGAQFDRVLRYGRTIQRELLYCVDQLQKLQRARKRKEPPRPMEIQSLDRR